MATSVRFTIADLAVMPDDGNVYEIIDGELLVSTQPHFHHQVAWTKIGGALDTWSTSTGAGIACGAPGVIFSDTDAVAPDVVWISAERLPYVLQEDGKLHGAPDLVVELLSPGATNERRDREAKLKLYSVRGVREYWIVDWRARSVEVYRREHAALQLVATLESDDELQSPLLPGFSARVGNFFASGLK
jgi:Uma2 family endonuclease